MKEAPFKLTLAARLGATSGTPSWETFKAKVQEVFAIANIAPDSHNGFTRDLEECFDLYFAEKGSAAWREGLADLVPNLTAGKIK